MAIQEISNKNAFEYSPNSLEPTSLEMGEDAFVGIIGRFVESMFPYTEADRVALLGHYLVYFGAYIGRRVYAVADGAEHHTNLYLALIGETSKGRKGTAHRRTQQAYKRAFPTFVEKNVMGGLYTGEGLINHVRDGDPDADPEDKKADLGVSDKRLLFVEEELSSPLNRMKQPGNTLSAVLRSAWDGGTLQTVIKNEPDVATGAHISLIGHGVKDEIVEEIDRKTMQNGLANRFLWLWSNRSKYIPRPRLQPPDMDNLVADVQRALSRAESIYSNTLIDFDDTSGRLWSEVYGDEHRTGLSSGRAGLIGKLTNRAEAITLRIALTYASMDGAPAIRCEHLLAAIAVWQYSEKSVREIFGNATGNSHAETIAHALTDSPDGLTKAEIHRLFSGHIRAKEMQTAINDLLSVGRAESVSIRTEGRSREVIRAREANKEN
jgi:hypothetical protein